MSSLEPDLVSSAHPDLPAHLRAHLPAAQAAAVANVTWLKDHRAPELKALLADFAAVAKPGVDSRTRIQRVRFLAGQWSEVVRERSACRKGCSHCCHTPVAVPRSEAKLIAKQTGIPLNKQARVWPITECLDAAAAEFTGPACTFLKNGSCSIHAHRPLTCRTLLNMDDVELLCELVPGMPVPVPYANSSSIQGFFATLTLEDDYSDIREWFPPADATGAT